MEGKYIKTFAITHRYNSFLAINALFNNAVSNELENVDQIILKSPNDSDLLQITLKDMFENKKIFENFEKTSNFLLSRFRHNENTLDYFEKNKVEFQEKFKTLSDLADKLSSRLTDIHKEHQCFLKLVEKSNCLIKKAKEITDSNKNSNEDF